MHKEVDVVTLQVISHRLESIANEMELTILKSSFSIIVKEGGDASTAIFDAQGRTISQACAIPIHLGILMFSVPEILKAFPISQMQNGDIYIANDPYSGGTHLPDVTMVTPVIFQGEVVAFTVSMVHHQDIGAMLPGVPTAATSLYQEGLNLPPVKFYDAGRPVRSVHDIIRKNVRVSGIVMGDFRAQVAGVTVGKVRLLELIEEYGKDVILTAFNQLLDYSEALTREELKKIPDGSYSFVDYLDNDGVELDKPVKFQVTVTIRGSDFIADFSGSNPQTKGPLNCVPPSAYAAVAYVLKVITGGSVIPNNQGCFRMITCNLPKGSIVNPYPPAPVGIRATAVQELAVLLMGALIKVTPERLVACAGGFELLYIGGIDPLTNEEFVIAIPASVGTGGRPMKDGIDVISVDMNNMLSPPFESLEISAPLRIFDWGLNEDSGGAGEYRGGLGMTFGFEVLRGDNISVTSRGERFIFPAWGVFGGLAAVNSYAFVTRKTGEKEEIPSKRDFTLNEGDQFYFATSGGGGWGDPLKRREESVLRDVLDGRVSLEAAARDYGVVIEEDSMTITSEKTFKLRSEKTKLRGPITWTYDQGSKIGKK